MKKRYRELKVPEGESSVTHALETVKKNATTKFDETIEVSFNLNTLKKHSIRDTVIYPHLFGKALRILVFAKGEKAEEAKAAGVDHVGADDLIEKIAGGWIDFDVAIATPEMMKSIAKIAKTLGTKGLMPNPKAKTVTDNVKKAIDAFKAGRREFRANGEGIVNFPIGKASMSVDQLKENFLELYRILIKRKPTDLKGDYIKSIALSSTMGKGVRVDRKKPDA